MTTERKTLVDHKANFVSDDGEQKKISFMQSYVRTDDYGEMSQWSKSGNLNPVAFNGGEFTGTVDALTDIKTGKKYKKISDFE